MTSYNNRIRSSEVQIGESLNLSSRQAAKKILSPEEIQKAELEEHLRNIERMLAEANAQSAEIIKKATAQAEEIIRKAQEGAAQEAELLKQQSAEQGYNDGFAKGQQEGTLQAKQELINKVWGVDILTSAAFDVKKEIIISAEKEIIELAIVIAENILRQKLDVEPELMRKIAKSAIDQLNEKEDIKIIVNPALVNNFYEYVEELKEEIRGLKTVKITEDKTIPKDGVIVESPESRIDGRLATRMSEITKNLMREYSEKANSNELAEEINIIIDERAEKLKKID